jgi:iron complex outermembrane receptor protein
MSSAVPARKHARGTVKMKQIKPESSPFFLPARPSALRAGCSVFALFSALALFGNSKAAADDQTTSATSKDELSEVIVTARRREESLEKVPVSEVVLSADALRDAGIKDERDLLFVIPGLQITYGQDGNQMAFAIRGQTLDPVSGSPPGVNVYIDNIALNGNVESANGLYDMGNVEVLKGPQGTLFGRNATGGSVLYNTAMPSDTYGGNIDAKFGDYNLRDFEGAVTIPVVPGKLDLRFAGDVLNYDGYETNVQDGRHPGTTNYQSGRVSMLFTPTDDLKSSTVVQYSKEQGLELLSEVYAVASPGQTNGGQALGDTAYLVTGGAILNYLNTTQKQNGIYKVDTLFGSEPNANHSLLAENTTTYDITPNLQLKNIIGLTAAVTLEGANNTGAPYNVLNLVHPADCCGKHGIDSFHFNQDNWSEELQFLGNSANDELKYVFGGYAANQYEYYDYPVDFAGTILNYEYNTNDLTKGLYGQVTYDLSRLTGITGLSTTEGIRYTWENLSQSQGAKGLFPGGPNQHSAEGDKSWTDGLEYQITQQQLIYVANRGSWRAGGYDDQSPYNNFNFFGPEQTYDFEVGTKFSGQIYDHPARVNVAVFDQISSNVQKNIYLTVGGVPSSSTLNVPQMIDKGVELDGEYHVTKWLRVGGNGAYNFAKFTKPYVELLGSTTRVTDVTNTPKWQMSFFVKTILPTPDAMGQMSLKADTYTQSDDYFSSFYFAQVPGSKVTGYTLLNFHYDWEGIYGSNVALSAYVKNALDRQFFLGGLPTMATDGENTAIPGPPRSFGVELNYTF